MRSRYTAYTRGNVDYLVATHDPATLDGFDRVEARRWATRARFSALEVRAVERGGRDDDEGIVEFVARFSEGAKLLSHHERSRFRRVEGRWVYRDAAPPLRRRPAEKVGRNDPCPCGSGRKHKKCCGAPGR